MQAFLQPLLHSSHSLADTATQPHARLGREFCAGKGWIAVRQPGRAPIFCSRPWCGYEDRAARADCAEQWWADNGVKARPARAQLLMIQTHLLTKRYGTLAALRDCSLRVEKGEVLGLLGPNGAGKTTLLRLLLG